MRILLIDDNKTNRIMARSILKRGGITDITEAETAHEGLSICYELCQTVDRYSTPFDLILMDLFMPGIGGIEATTKVKSYPELSDIPIIMVTADEDKANLQKAFEAGAVDYIRKPVDKIELITRVNSVLRLKQEMDARKARERELLEIKGQLESANEQLKKLSVLDGLTGIANRRVFDSTLDSELKRLSRGGGPLSLIMMDIDFFKRFNDTYGHQAGDDCLKKVATALDQSVQRTTDKVARYGGEEFGIILANTGRAGALEVANGIQKSVANIKIPHKASEASKFVTLSMGVATLESGRVVMPKELIETADKALYASKHGGRNRTTHADDLVEELETVTT